MGGGFSVFLLLKPIERALRVAAAGGGNLLAGWTGCGDSSAPLGLDGTRGGTAGLVGRLGLAGTFGSKSRSTMGGSRIPFGVDFVVINGARLGLVVFSASSRSRLVGGSGGSFACSNGGGIFLPSPIDDPLVAEEPWPRDIPDIVELTDIVEEPEPLLPC